MTVKDLIDIGGDNLEGIQIRIRENGGGKWLHGYRISPNERLYPAISKIENQEAFPWITKKGDFNQPIPRGAELRVYETMRDNLPIDIMCISPKKAPKHILNLEVRYMLPRNIPSVHGERLFNNGYMLELDCYPPQKLEKLAIYKEVEETEQLEGQMCIEEWLGGLNGNT